MASRDEPSETWRSRPTPALVRAIRPIIRALSRFHPVRLEGMQHLPEGPALLVGNHGLLGYESPLFFERILAACGRLPIGLADKWFFEVPLLRDLLVRVGGTYGSVANGLSELLWERSAGFVRLALAAKVPTIPFAAAGVDDTFDVVGHWRGSGELLMGHGKYDLPVVWGRRGPLPNPVPFWFRLGEPIHAPEGASDRDEDVVRELHRQVWSRTQSMVDGLVAEWKKAA